MPQVKIGELVVVVGTATKDAECKYVGDKKTAMTTFGVAVGKNASQQTIYANCKAWRRLAEYAAGIRKGDAVMAVGQIEEREYNGKTYKTLNCDWLNYPQTGERVVPDVMAGAQEIDDSELPF
jgi:hypothetical protein